MTDPIAMATPLSAAEVQSLVNMADGDRLAGALWAEFGFGNPDDTGGRPRSLDPDDPYWAVAAERLRERVASLDAEPTAREDGRSALLTLRGEVAEYGTTYPDGQPRDALAASRIPRRFVLDLIDNALAALPEPEPTARGERS